MAIIEILIQLIMIIIMIIIIIIMVHWYPLLREETVQPFGLNLEFDETLVFRHSQRRIFHSNSISSFPSIMEGNFHENGKLLSLRKTGNLQGYFYAIITFY